MASGYQNDGGYSPKRDIERIATRRRCHGFELYTTTQRIYFLREENFQSSGKSTGRRPALTVGLQGGQPRKAYAVTSSWCPVKPKPDKIITPPTGANNGKLSAAKQSKTVIGRKWRLLMGSEHGFIHQRRQVPKHLPSRLVTEWLTPKVKLLEQP